MRHIPRLYHWAPSSARASILEHGLRPTCPTRNGTLAVCLSPDPVSAWALSGALREPGAWDLWQANVADTPVMRIRHWGRVAEYRIPRTILPCGLTLVAVRRPGDV